MSGLAATVEGRVATNSGGEGVQPVKESGGVDVGGDWEFGSRFDCGGQVVDSGLSGGLGVDGGRKDVRPVTEIGGVGDGGSRECGGIAGTASGSGNGDYKVGDVGLLCQDGPLSPEAGLLWGQLPDFAQATLRAQV